MINERLPAKTKNEFLMNLDLDMPIENHISDLMYNSTIYKWDEYTITEILKSIHQLYKTQTYSH